MLGRRFSYSFSLQVEESSQNCDPRCPHHFGGKHDALPALLRHQEELHRQQSNLVKLFSAMSVVRYLSTLLYKWIQ